MIMTMTERNVNEGENAESNYVAPITPAGRLTFKCDTGELKSGKPLYKTITLAGIDTEHVTFDELHFLMGKFAPVFGLPLDSMAFKVQHEWHV